MGERCTVACIIIEETCKALRKIRIFVVGAVVETAITHVAVSDSIPWVLQVAGSVC